MKQCIQSVSIKKLWDVKNISVTFNEDINILIGGNGSGKTTFLRIIESLLNLDLASIEEIIFDEVTIVVKGDEDNVITVQRLMEDLVTYVYRYTFSDGETIDIKSSDVRMNYRSRLASRGLYQHLKEKLDNLVKVSWLSINRISDSIDRSDRRLMDSSRTDVDLKLAILMNQIISYRLQLETKVNNRTKKFNEDIVSLLLYNQSYDSLPTIDQIQRIKSYSKEDIVTELHKVFSYFGDPRLHTEEIKNHA
jgi:energy-coupling factor transporter ATP-binding protein EcfA2